MTDMTLSTQNLSAGYNGAAIVEGLNLTFPNSQFTALLGPNGCGKSTLLRTLAGLQPAIDGDVLLGQSPIKTLGTKALARRVSILAQSAQAPDGLTVGDLVRQGRYPHRKLLGGWSPQDSQSVDEALQLTHMSHLSDHLMTHLSGGQRQRAWIAMTLAQQGDILLLDEPTSYLDLAHQIEVLNLVSDLIVQKGVTVVAVLHDLNQAARYADNLVLLKAGRLYQQGTPEDILTSEHVQHVFGVDVSIIPDPETATPLCIPKRLQTLSF